MYIFDYHDESSCSRKKKIQEIWLLYSQLCETGEFGGNQLPCGDWRLRSPKQRGVGRIYKLARDCGSNRAIIIIGGDPTETKFNRNSKNPYKVHASLRIFPYVPHDNCNCKSS